ncbi:ER degradation-enhancing alpha-mannosidase-like protein 3 [Phytophthora cactorum]|uniref:alpha-1,2-Mannosidase n=1 Tax=Phytophthora cactorum TaxID=29920 RepID=A0A329S4G6_9STRA|nr:ER degradation-enhancing alpha-mannosidase-like protein 3 [Phytophthora cactorum]KAG2824114.1 ER degradation-enhancing alpha-mannosidase-like protein 3 [Phytophthora cactorum]KAG2830310.1 ER degradation-enhancing alpha-mannosidase-like protein 3 [Phytophthora cactorum]KAG2857800.1 ER degradation-enhancing alpha-mannosidase-like protein 3 [Phytophthora cactorum]KAG2903257.1 ER degradation-enhancing alpha-mannosidase-like protein 3 [Phytophthora cactorum]
MAMTRYRVRPMRLRLVFLFMSVALLGTLCSAHMHVSELRYLQQQARDMFYHGYRNYMEHAYPWDELKPLSCSGRRWDRRERGDLDDVLGGFSLTLVDSLDMLAVLGDRDEFACAVKLVSSSVSFDRDVTVSVFESTIRVIGGLVSAHMLASPEYFGMMDETEYNGELLELAEDLGRRLLPAFETPTGIPVHRVNLRRGVLPRDRAANLTCPAAAGSLLVEMAYLSRLTGDESFEERAKQAVVAIWERRSDLDLLGSSIDVGSGQWIYSHGGIGAGLDSFYEYLLKYHLISGDSQWLAMFNASYHAVETHVNHDDVYIEVDMNGGRNQVRARRVSALQAFWPGLQVLAGDVSGAIRTHEHMFSLWDEYGAMPELLDLAPRGTSKPGNRGTVISWARTAPLRPELIESTYHLYQATKDHKYLKMGRQMLQDIRRVSEVPCGYAAVRDIHTLDVEDRMDSYFLSETAKYLYLLFSDEPDVIVPAPARQRNITTAATNRSCSGTIPDEKHTLGSSIPCEPRTTNVSSTLEESSYVRRNRKPLKASDVVFSTEGHILMLDSHLFRRTTTQKSSASPKCENGKLQGHRRNVELEVARQVQATPPVIPVGVAVRIGGVHVMTLVASPAKFGLQVTTPSAVEAPLLLFTPDIGEACGSIDTDRVRGKIVMVARGTCTFAEKALRLQSAGAVGVVAINSKATSSRYPNRKYSLADDARGLGQHVTIPVVLVAREDATQLHRHASLKWLLGDDEGDSDGENDVQTDSDVLIGSLSPWLY